MGIVRGHLYTVQHFANFAKKVVPRVGEHGDVTETP